MKPLHQRPSNPSSSLAPCCNTSKEVRSSFSIKDPPLVQTILSSLISASSFWIPTIVQIDCKSYSNIKAMDHFNLRNKFHLSCIATNVFSHITSIKLVLLIHNGLQSYGGQCSILLYTLLLLPVTIKNLKTSLVFLRQVSYTTTLNRHQF